MAKRKEPDSKTSRQQVKKQRGEERGSTSAEESVRPGSPQSPPPPANALDTDAQKPSSQRLRVKRPAARRTVAKSGSAPAHKANVISSVVRMKVQQVLEFTARKSPAKSSSLEREGSNWQHAVVAESAAMAALMRMRSDYQISEPSLASLDDIGEILVHTSTRRIGGNPSVQHVVLDLSKRSLLEASIQSKLQGHGTAEISLLEVELEMLARDVETAIANDLFRNVQTIYDEHEEPPFTIDVVPNVAYQRSTARDACRPITPCDETKDVARIDWHYPVKVMDI